MFIMCGGSTRERERKKRKKRGGGGGELARMIKTFHNLKEHRGESTDFARESSRSLRSLLFSTYGLFRASSRKYPDIQQLENVYLGFLYAAPRRHRISLIGGISPAKPLQP